MVKHEYPKYKASAEYGKGGRSSSVRIFGSQKASFTKTVVSVICEYLDCSREKAGTDAYWEKFTSVIREELASHNPLAGLLNLLQTASAQSPSVPSTDAEDNTAETEEVLFGFLDSF